MSNHSNQLISSKPCFKLFSGLSDGLIATEISLLCEDIWKANSGIKLIQKGESWRGGGLNDRLERSTKRRNVWSLS